MRGVSNIGSHTHTHLLHRIGSASGLAGTASRENRSCTSVRCVPQSGPPVVSAVAQSPSLLCMSPAEYRVVGDIHRYEHSGAGQRCGLKL